MRLFVDDLRNPPEGWEGAKTITEAIRILATQTIEEVSLDHDIGCRLVNGHEHSSNETFEAVAHYIRAMFESGYRPKVRIHTANIQAGIRMAQILNIPYDKEIYDPKNY